MKINANDYKSLCEQADEMSKNTNKGEMTSNGWLVVDNKRDKRSNFKGVLYQKGSQYALCFVGTDKYSMKDHGANLKMGLTGKSKQIKNARDFAREMQDSYNLTQQNTVSIGHSEGGTEATHVGIENGLKTITFNAFGVSKKELPQGENFDRLVTNYRDAHDPVSKMHKNVGTTYIVPTTQTPFMAKTPFGSVQAHGIKNMGNCDYAVPVEDYKKRNPLFLDKITDAEITREDINDMDSELFSVYEPEIDKRLVNNQIFSANQLSGSNGTVYVNGYTKNDGTEVKGYYRRLAYV